MARVLKFRRRRRYAWWPRTAAPARFRYRRHDAVRPQTIALAAALVFATTLSVLRQSETAADPFGGLSPASVSEGWARAAANPPELVRIEDVERIAPITDRPAATSEPGVTVHRGSATAGATARAIGGIRFSICHSGGGTNCVVDGDTFWLRGEKIRIADIDTPETHPPRCAAEAAKGAAATRRLQALLNAGPFELDPIDRDTDRYGRKLRVVTRDGASIGGMLVEEGLARWYGGGRQPWC